MCGPLRPYVWPLETLCWALETLSLALEPGTLCVALETLRGGIGRMYGPVRACVPKHPDFSSGACEACLGNSLCPYTVWTAVQHTQTAYTLWTAVQHTQTACTVWTAVQHTQTAYTVWTAACARTRSGQLAADRRGRAAQNPGSGACSKESSSQWGEQPRPKFRRLQ